MIRMRTSRKRDKGYEICVLMLLFVFKMDIKQDRKNVRTVRLDEYKKRRLPSGSSGSVGCCMQASGFCEIARFLTNCHSCNWSALWPSFAKRRSNLILCNFASFMLML